MGTVWVTKWLPGKAVECGDLHPLPTGRDEGPASEPDEGLVDECCLLPSQLLVPSLDWLPASDGLVSRLQPKQPLRLRFGRAPTLPSNTSTLQLDGLARCAHLPVLPSPHALPCLDHPAAPESVHTTGSLRQGFQHILEPGVSKDQVLFHQVSAIRENFGIPTFAVCIEVFGFFFCLM